MPEASLGPILTKKSLKEFDILSGSLTTCPSSVLTLVLVGGCTNPPNGFRPGAQNRTAKG